MIWTNLAMLVAGLGLGTIGSWWIGRSSPKSPEPASTIASVMPSHLDPVTFELEKQAFELEKQAWKAQLRQAQLSYGMATEMEKFKSGFLARSSHELRSPINSVISLHQLILADLCESPDEEREFIAQAQTSAEKMLGLLDRLISLSKLVYGTEPMQIQPLHLGEVLAEVQHFTELQAQNRSLRLEISLPEPTLWVQADPRWLRQVLISLIDMPMSLMQEGYIRLQAQVETDQQQVNILIEDQRPVEFWQEPVDWLNAVKVGSEKWLPTKEAVQMHVEGTRVASNIPSPGLNLLMVQTLLERMGCRLEILATPLTETKPIEDAANPLSGFTRLQCSLPLAVAETKMELEKASKMPQ
ncbi:MAG: HAMP domain-containing histidine kinase [Leptolyngbyaceae cyanobacterium CRU_2_3]|nr:HAMP domain-containing histidine kinase [Leptolyngbyaceae cyanobacterium CRU_2_3]